MRSIQMRGCTVPANPTHTNRFDAALALTSSACNIIKPAFAITINKSQGQTFQVISVDVTAPFVTHGMSTLRHHEPAALTI